MRINKSSVLVDDQAKALHFYIEGTELVLEPDEHPAAKPFKSALVEDGIPFTSFAVRDVAAEYKRLEPLGVNSTQPPVDYGTVITAVFDDTCGNLVQIAQEVSQS